MMSLVCCVCVWSCSQGWFHLRVSQWETISEKCRKNLQHHTTVVEAPSSMSNISLVSRSSVPSSVPTSEWWYSPNCLHSQPTPLGLPKSLSSRPINFFPNHRLFVCCQVHCLRLGERWIETGKNRPGIGQIRLGLRGNGWWLWDSGCSCFLHEGPSTKSTGIQDYEMWNQTHMDIP